MMPVAMAQEASPEANTLGHLYLRHAPEGIRLAFLLTGDRVVEDIHAMAEPLVDAVQPG